MREVRGSHQARDTRAARHRRASSPGSQPLVEDQRIARGSASRRRRAPRRSRCSPENGAPATCSAADGRSCCRPARTPAPRAAADCPRRRQQIERHVAQGAAAGACGVRAVGAVRTRLSAQSRQHERALSVATSALQRLARRVDRVRDRCPCRFPGRCRPRTAAPAPVRGRRDPPVVRRRNASRASARVRRGGFAGGRARRRARREHAHRHRCSACQRANGSVSWQARAGRPSPGREGRAPARRSRGRATGRGATATP